MTYKTLPWDTDEEIDGVRLQDILLPSLEGDLLDFEAIFDVWLDSIDDGIKKMLDDIADYEPAGPSLSMFMSRHGIKQVDEATVLLLFAMGHAPGLSVEFGDNSIFVSNASGKHFGIDEHGAVHSRFGKGKTLKVRPMEFLSTRRDILCFNTFFISLYREAYRVYPPCINALIALRTGDPLFNFRKLANDVIERKVMSETKVSCVEQVLLTQPDPLRKLYKNLVPRWMTATEFTRVFQNLNTRAGDPTMRMRKRMATNIKHFFYNVK